MKSDFRFERFDRKFSINFFGYNLILNALKRIDHKIIPKGLLNKGINQPRLKFNLRLVRIGLQTTEPRKIESTKFTRDFKSNEIQVHQHCFHLSRMPYVMNMMLR